MIHRKMNEGEKGKMSREKERQKGGEGGAQLKRKEECVHENRRSGKGSKKMI